MSPTINGCEIGPVLGRGGFATVYRGRQLTVDREVAIKIDSRVVDDERNRRRFLREATASGRIDTHPHVVSLIDVGTTEDNRPYLVMEYCPGGSIADVLKERGVFSVADACDLGIAISSALAAAHDHGILHRDVKPANILIDSFGTPRLSDFGLAAFSQPDNEISVTLEAMTPAYSPPEVLMQQVPTPRSDVWSMGATIYAMISGQPPRKRPDGTAAGLPEIMTRINEPFPDPGLPGSHALMSVIHRATHPDPAYRYPTARELHAALREVRGHLGPGVTVVGGPEAALTQVRTLPTTNLRQLQAVTGPPKRRWPAAVAGLLVGILLGGISGVASVLVAKGSDPTPLEGSSPPSTPTSPSSAPTRSETPTPSPTPQEKPPTVGRCWTGIVNINGSVSSTQVDCSQPHAWETYASGLLDPATPDHTTTSAANDPVVKSTCTVDNARAYVEGKKMEARLLVIPPTEAQFLAGRRGFACVITKVGEGTVVGSIKDR